MKKQIRVLREILRARGKITVKELMKSSFLTEREVHNALRDLKNRRLIKKTKISEGAERRTPPLNKIYIEINKGSLKRIKQLIRK